MKQNCRHLMNIISLVMIELLVVSSALAAPPVIKANLENESSYQHAAVISTVEMVNRADGTEILVHASKALDYKTYNFENPARIAIDFDGFGLASDQQNIVSDTGPVTLVTSREFKNETDILTRIEIALAEDALEHAKIAVQGTTLSVFLPAGFSSQANLDSPAVANDTAPAGDIFTSLEATTPEITIPAPKTTRNDDSAFVQIAQAQTAQAGSYLEKTIGSDDVQSIMLPDYEGIPISLDLKNADVIDIFMTIADLTGYNVIIDPKVKGKINIKMNQVPWDQALDIILRQMELGKEYTGTKTPEFPRGNIIRIAPVNSLRKEAEERRKLLDAQKISEPLITKIIYLSYAEASQMDKIVKKLLSKRGEIIVDKRTNSMLLTDIPANLEKIRNMVTLLDVRTRQVLIASKIITTKKDFTRQLGIAWGSTFIADAPHGNTTGYRFPNHGAVDYAVSLPQGASILGVTLGNVLDTFQLSAILTASEQEGLTKVISNPRVMTSDNVEAEIKSGYQLPYIIWTDRGLRYAFKDATISLKVKPHVTHDSYIDMKIEAKKDSPDFSTDPVSIFTNRAKTEVLVRDGDTFVIGGLNQTTTGWDSARLPFLHRIPIIGLLFKNQNIKNAYDDLLVFITPKIIQQEQTQVQSISFDQSILPAEDKKTKK